MYVLIITACITAQFVTVDLEHAAPLAFENFFEEFGLDKGSIGLTLVGLSEVLLLIEHFYQSLR